MTRAALVLTALAAAALPAQAAATPRAIVGGSADPAAAVAPESQLRVVESRRSFGTRFVRYRQVVGGLPVLGSDTVLSDVPGSRGDLLLDGTRQLRGRPAVATLSRGQAIRIARRAGDVLSLRAAAKASLAVLPRAGGARAVWRVLLPARHPLASFEVLVDARSGAVLRLRDQLKHATGTARVFDTNPVVFHGTAIPLPPAFPLVDNGDANSDELDAALGDVVTLERLTDDNTCVEGQWVHATLPDGPDGDEDPEEVCAPGRDFSAWRREDDEFEPVMAYFHIDRVQQGFLRDTLGITNVLDRQLRVHANDFEDDNSFYDPNNGEISFGEGGTDDGEDGEVIVHEYGHAIQDDQVGGFGETDEGGAMGEGFSDYLAAAVSATYMPAARASLTPCIAEWDQLGFLEEKSQDIPAVPCLRRADKDLTVAQVGPGSACDGEVHCAGEAWSGALWDIRAAIGPQAADRLVIQSHESLTPDAGFHEGALALFAADQALYGGVHLTFLRNLLTARGLYDVERLDDQPAGARPLAIPGTASSTLSAGRDVHDVYSVALTRGRSVIFRLSSAVEEIDLRLLAPGAASTADDGAVVAAAETTGSNERLAYTPAVTGTHFLDVVAIAGSGAYTVTAALDSDGDQVADEVDNCATMANTAQRDRDGDGVGDMCDNCPGAGNRAQTDWNRDDRGDRCDRSAKVSLRRVGKTKSRGGKAKRRTVTLRATLRPALLGRRGVKLEVRRRGCRPKCAYRKAPARVRKSAAGPGRVKLRVRLRKRGRYRVRAVLTDKRYARARSRRLALKVR